MTPNTGFNKNDARLEAYLEALSRALKPLSVSDRSEIITEIKSHVLSALERDPEASVDSILHALGEAQTVANRYLMERGSKPIKPPISPVLKWMVIGFLGTLAMLLLFAGAMVWRFFPIIKVQGDHKVSILGGLIDIDDNNVRLHGQHIPNFDVDHYDNHFEGSLPLDQKSLSNTKFKIGFENGKVNFKTSKGDVFTWSCKSKESDDSKHTKNGVAPKVSEDRKNINFDLKEMGSVRCDLALPAKVILNVAGANGKIDFDSPQFTINADLENGAVNFLPSMREKYRFELDTELGFVDGFTSSDAPEALSVKIKVKHGKINNEGGN